MTGLERIEEAVGSEYLDDAILLETSLIMQEQGSQEMEINKQPHVNKIVHLTLY